MNIIYIANARIPTEKAHGLQIMKMCEAFASAGASVELVVPRRKNETFAGVDPFAYYGVKQNFTLTYLSSIDPTWLTRVYQGLYIKVQGLWFGLAVRRFYQKKYSQDKEATIYVRDEYLLPLLPSDARIVWEGHTLSQKPKKYVRFFQHCHRIVVLTKSLAADIAALGVSAERILVAGDGVDIEKIQINETQQEARTKLQLPPNKKIILYTGHLYQWKGVYTLAEASQYLADDAMVVLVGGTEADQQKMKDFITLHKLDKVMLIGHRPPVDIPYYLRAADVVVLPNSGKEKISSHYTSPLKLFEYMAAQKPIIASRLPSITEILNDANAFLVNPDDAEGLAAGINKMCADTTYADYLAAQAYRDVSHQTWNQRALNIFNFIS